MGIPAQFRNFVDADGRIKRMPVKMSKKVELSQWLLTQLDTQRVYSEKELNEVFEAYVDDFALMRRMLVEAGHLERDRYGYEYRRIVAAEARA
jgi:hypothetical protein